VDYNRITARLIFQILHVRGWSELELSRQSGVHRSVLSAQLSGERAMRAQHVIKYLAVLDHQERPKLLAAWLRDHLPAEVVDDLLDITGESLSLDVKRWTPALEEDKHEMLLWWAREIARDGELKELFSLLSTKAGYRPRPLRKATGLGRRRKR
jgi:hypothetical protein